MPSTHLADIKRKFEIIGNNPTLNRALEKAVQVAPTDISVLVVGESGVGKEFIPKIIHSESPRKHKKFISVNCGAIPEGTIDSELFGHEKGAFTGATQTRQGYFEAADGGTIFLDEVGELPLPTQVRLLRVLESGEFIKVGSSQTQKTDVRVVAATNRKMQEAVSEGKFREDLYYRLNTVQIDMPALRQRKEDIYLLFRKFASDFAEKYAIPPVDINDEAQDYLRNFYWPGNVRQLRNLVEQLTVVSEKRNLNLQELQTYLPPYYPNQSLVTLKHQSEAGENSFSNEREILYKFLFDMKRDLNDLKSLTFQLLKNSKTNDLPQETRQLVNKVYDDYLPDETPVYYPSKESIGSYENTPVDNYATQDIIEAEQDDETLSIQDKEQELIKKALDKYKGRRRKAAEELGISERTLYRKIKQYDLE